MINHICKSRTKYSSSRICSLVSQHLPFIWIPRALGEHVPWNTLGLRSFNSQGKQTYTKHGTHSSSSHFCFKKTHQNYLKKAPVRQCAALLRTKKMKHTTIDQMTTLILQVSLSPMKRLKLYCTYNSKS